MQQQTQRQPESRLGRIGGWFLPRQPANLPVAESDERLDWARVIPYAIIHLMCLGVIWVGWSWAAVGVALFLYALRVFTLTGFYHRYFSHRAFKCGRITQFIFGWIGCTSVQRGPLWWAAHHRHHHVHSDDPEDIHSPRQKGAIWAHMGWFLTPRAEATNLKFIPDFAKYPELRWLNRFDLIPPLVLGFMLYGLGELLAYCGIGATTGLQMVIWGMFISTVAVYHVTYLVNSATHIIGRRRYETKDDSKNSMIVALLTFGEGWHNNHHYYPNSVRQGFYWWEIDITWYVLKMMAGLGLVWELRPVPQRILNGQPRTAPATVPPATVAVQS